MSGVSCLCSVAVGGRAPSVARCFQLPLLVFCVLCCERFRLGHRWYPVCLCRRPLRPAAGFGLCAYTGGVPVPFPAAVGGGMLVVRPGTVQARRASSARSFPRDGQPRGALPFAMCATGWGAVPVRRFCSMVRAATLLSLVLVAAGSAGAGISGVASVTDGDTLRIGPARIRLHDIDAPESAQSCRAGGETWA